MKIKKLFGLATVASLGLLMTACGKTKKNASILNDDYFDTFAIDLAEYKEGMKKKGSVEEICSDKEYVAYNNNIYIARDTDKYYFYNLSLEGKLLFAIDRADYSSYSISSDYGCIRITYKTNADGDYGYAYYAFDGTELLAKTYCRFAPSVSYNSGETYMDGEDTTNINGYRITYAVTEGSTYAYKYAYYYKVLERKMQTYQSTTTYLTEAEYNEKYGKVRSQSFDGTMYGLKGYSLQTENNILYLFKGKSLVNALSIDETSTLISDGCFFYQTYKKVSASDDYDIFLNGEYLVVNSYSLNVKTSKLTKLKNFHYYVNRNSAELVIVDGVIDSFLCEVIDYKKKKNADESDVRLARLDAKGNIDVHEAMSLMSSSVVKVDKEYYVYNFSASHSTTQDATVVYDKNGNVKQVYDGIYYDGVTVNLYNETAYFTDKEGNTVYYLNSCTRIDAATYIGYDIQGTKMIVEIKDGNISKADCSGYTTFNSMLFTKTNGDNVEFYTYDSSLTSIGFSYDTTKESITSLGNGYYRVYNSNTGNTKVIYFA